MKTIGFVLALAFILLHCATASASVYATITWKANSTDQTSFQLFRRINPTPTSPAPAKIADIDRTYFTTVDLDLDKTFPSGTVVCYSVAAVNGMGSSALSNEACVTIPNKPAAPTVLTVTLPD